MPQSYSKIYLHTIFSTKYRRPMIHPSVEEELYGALRGLFHEQGCIVIEIGGTFDHVHIVHTLPRTMSIAKVLESVKSLSTKGMKKDELLPEDFNWQDGYSCFSVDYRKLEGLILYVRNQKRHHYGDEYGEIVRMTFETEYKTILDAFDCDYDPQFLFPREK